MRADFNLAQNAYVSEMKGINNMYYLFREGFSPKESGRPSLQQILFVYIDFFLKSYLIHISKFQVKVWKTCDEITKNDIIVMGTDGLWDVVSNKVIFYLTAKA